ncbi:uncharacterized protein LOC105381752 isoform X3 [Plutella xylostella]|uniref:uncharacterized protein LOC105381752 isoform X3 n=1 Tax=Plutella xylostella TaxID=51655 RepID=UPI0020326F77|nr:uncharacterized protein LOC105381752 isoform X3 [Plutella xylostella]
MNKMESKQEPGSKKNRMRDKNWQDEEKAILKNLVKKYIQDIENKKLDTDSNKRKYEAWKKICTSFNQQSKCGTRTIDQLKIRWKLMKMMAKAKRTDNNCSKACDSPTSFGDSNYSMDNTNESFSCDSYAVDQSDSDDSIPETIRISKPSLQPIPSTNSVSEQVKLYMNHLVKSASTMQTKLYKLKTENAKKKEHILLMKREYWRIKLNSVVMFYCRWQNPFHSTKRFTLKSDMVISVVKNTGAS